MGTALKKVVFTGGLLVAAALLLTLATLLWYRSASQPQVTGLLRLSVAMPAGTTPFDTTSTDGTTRRSEGATRPAATIQIVRDADAVAHIYAAGDNDAFFGLGFVHAQDRLWQLEMHRRIASGTLAEILGPSALDTDRFLRTLGVHRNAEAILPNLAPDIRAALQAYADGINAYLRHRREPLPPEFFLTGAPVPQPWHPADSVAWQSMMAWDLGGNWSQELMRMRLSQKLSLAQINELLPPYPGDAPLPTQDYTGWYRSLAGTLAQLTAVAAVAPPSQVDGMGSNNWVVSGARTATGKPLLANDPHLGLTAPALWYLAHLSAPGMNVIGASMPGVPGIVLGHNDRIAWGFTNTAPDVQDLYIERVNQHDPHLYQTPGGWELFGTRVENIKVKGQPDVPLVVRSTRHGPVISGALPLVDRAPLDVHAHVIALAWTALRADDLTIQGGMRINRAQNWSQFMAAVRDFHSPQQNIGYADVDGNIGFVAPGRIPVRRIDNDLHGLAPAPGWDARYDWQGFVQFEDLPQYLNPASQQIVTANQKIVGATNLPFLTSEWSLPYRAERIGQLLDARGKHDVDSFAAIQYDHVSLAARDLLPILRATRPQSPSAAEALALLASWNGEMDTGRPEPLIYNAWTRALSRRLLAAPLGPELMGDYFDQRTAQPALANILKNPDGESHWCVVPAEEAAPAAANCAALLSITLDSSLAALAGMYGPRPGKWHWDAAHVARMEHRPFGRVPALAPFFNIIVPVPGDTYTVNVGSLVYKGDDMPFASRHAAGLRSVYDLSDLERSRFIQSSGQSGNRMSPLYANFAQRWSQGASIPMRTRRADVERNKLGTLTLVR